MLTPPSVNTRASTSRYTHKHFVSCITETYSRWLTRICLSLQITEHLSTQENLFTQDGAVGSFKDDRTRVRVISDSPVVALFAQSLLVRVPTKDPHAARPIVVYVATAGEFQDQEPKALLFLDKNDDGALFAKVVITGAADLSSIKDAIGLAKKKLLEHTETESVVLPGDVVLKGDKSALVFNSTGAFLIGLFYRGCSDD